MDEGFNINVPNPSPIKCEKKYFQGKRSIKQIIKISCIHVMHICEIKLTNIDTNFKNNKKISLSTFRKVFHMAGLMAGKVALFQFEVLRVA